MSPSKILCVCLLSSMFLACEDEEDGDSGDASAVCAVTEDPGPEQSCGTFDESDEACGGSDGGGSDTGDLPCDPAGGEGQAIADCVLQAVADGVACSFGYHSSTNAGQYETSISYHVGADGAVWTSRTSHEDLCSSGSTRVLGVADFSGCTSYECVRERAGSAPEVEVCESWEDCSGI